VVNFFNTTNTTHTTGFWGESPTFVVVAVVFRVSKDFLTTKTRRTWKKPQSVIFFKEIPDCARMTIFLKDHNAHNGF